MEIKMEIMTNKTYSTSVKIFKAACTLANVEPTQRQASKFQRNCGKAFGYKEQAKKIAYKR